MMNNLTEPSIIFLGVAIGIIAFLLQVLIGQLRR